MGGKTGAAAPKASADKATSDPQAPATVPLPNAEAIAAALMLQDDFRVLVAECCKSSILGLLDPVKEDLLRFSDMAEKMPPIPTAADILAADGFADGVAQIVTARVQSDDFPATIKPAIDDYLDANLPELVAAAMPETPEVVAAREAKAAAKAQGERERADQRAARERAEAEAAERAEREGRKADKREQRASLIAAKPDPAPVDLTMVKRGTLFIDDGDHLSIDFAREVLPGELEATGGEGSNAILLKAPAITLGADMPEPFRVEAAILVLEMEQGHRVLACPMLSPLSVGGGATAQLGENSLSFRPT